MIGPTVALIGCACVGVASVAGRVNGSRKRRRKVAEKPARVGAMYGSLSIQDRERKFNAITQRTRPPMRCPAMPWLPDQVTSTLMELIAQGVRDEESLTLTTLYEVYDETVHGEPIIWPTIPDDCAEMKAIEERVRIRVRLVLAELIDAEADEIYPP